MRHPVFIFLFKCFLIGLGLAVAAATHPGITFQTETDLVLVSLLVGFLNAFLRPILILFTLPFVLFTFGLGLVVINALLILLAGEMVEGFILGSFWAAAWAAVLVSIISMLANGFLIKRKMGNDSTVTYSARVRGPDGKVRVVKSREARNSGKKIRSKSKPGDDDDVIDI